MEDRWGIPVAILEENMSSYDLTERIVFDTKIRISEYDIMTAKICHTMACLWCSGSPPRFEDFLPHQKISEDEIDSEQFFNKFQDAFTKGMNK